MNYDSDLVAGLDAWLHQEPRRFCPHCGSEIPKGGTVTCTSSQCQEAEYHANVERNKRKRGRR